MKDSYENVAPEEPEASSVFFDKVLDRLNIDLNDPARLVILNWKNIVGEKWKYTTCDGIKNGILYVRCKHSAQAALFKMESREILKSIQTTFPELNVKKIFTRVQLDQKD